MTPQFINLVLVPLFIAFLVALGATKLVIIIYTQLGWLEDPQKTKRPKDTHTYPVPRGGGIAIFITLLLTVFILLPLEPAIKGILLASLILTILGVIDDRLDPSPYLRLLVLIAAACVIISSGISIRFITNPFTGIIDLPSIVSILITIVWIVSLTIVTDWVKGFDGQLPGIVAIAAITIAALAFKYAGDASQWPVLILASVTTGAYLGFLVFNFYPQKIMPGFGGGTLAGFLLAILAILSTTKILTAMVVLGIPIVDAFFTIARRLKQGKSPFWGDRSHLHHQILDLWGWSKPKTAIFYWLATAFLGVLALNLNSRQKFYTIIMLVIIIGALLLWLNFFSILFGQSGHAKHSKT